MTLYLQGFYANITYKPDLMKFEMNSNIWKACMFYEMKWCAVLGFIKNVSSSISLYKTLGLRDYENFFLFFFSIFVKEQILIKVSMNANTKEAQIFHKKE